MRTEIKAPGLAWRRRASGEVPYWIASKEAVRAGYPVSTVNLSCLDDDSIALRCGQLQSEMLAWLQGVKPPEQVTTLGALLRLYSTHPESPYHTHKPSTRQPYDAYMGMLAREHGTTKLEKISGLDIKGWHKVWRAPEAVGGKERLGAANMALSVLKAALAFGVVSGIPGCTGECQRLREVCALLRLPAPKPRQLAPTAADIERARAAAHELGRPSAALAYALQFETLVRQWDITGQWVELSHAQPSSVLAGGKKWIGPTWGNIDANMVLAIKPTKTERSTGATVHIDLRKCPMVMAELQRIPPAARTGPLIVNEAYGLPFEHQAFQSLWRRVRKLAGLPEELWNRDIRAGGNTEAEIAGASADDRAKLAGHSKKMNQQVYSRDRLAASDRVVELRARFREGGK